MQTHLALRGTVARRLAAQPLRLRSRPRNAGAASAVVWPQRSRLGWRALVVMAICIGFGLAFAIANIRSWQLEDAQAYWNAAVRLRDHASLYPSLANSSGADVYRYAPWVAWAWVPLTYLPKALVSAAWSVILIGAALAALVPLMRRPSPASIAVAALLGGLLVRTASTGNVQALLVAVLVWGAPRKSGPIWVGIAASMKVVPILYTLVYVGRREWREAATATGVAAALWAPVLLYDVGSYPSHPGESLSLLALSGPVIYAIVALVASAISVRLARTRYAWVSASAAVIAAIPRLDFYDLTYLLAGTSEPRPTRPKSDGTQRGLT